MMSPRALRTMRAGVCQCCQCSRIGIARARIPVTQSSWNQRTRSAPQHTSASHATVGGEVGEREPQQVGVFEPADVVLETWAWASIWRSQGGKVAVLVGVVAPEPVFKVG